MGTKQFAVTGTAVTCLCVFVYIIVDDAFLPSQIVKMITWSEPEVKMNISENATRGSGEVQQQSEIQQPCEVQQPGTVGNPGPSEEHEHIRRQMVADVRKLNKLVEDMAGRVSEVENMTLEGWNKTKTGLHEALGDLRGHVRTAANNIKFLENIDNNWRRNESLALGEIVQERIRQSQNPKNCSAAKKFVFSTYVCGFGCNIHILLLNLIIAHAEGRTLLIQDGWVYKPGHWNSFFLPISETCKNIPITKVPAWSGNITKDEKEIILRLPIFGYNAKIQKNIYLPPAIPEDLAPRLRRLHGNPALWWVGQFVKYLMRLQPELKKHVEQQGVKLGFNNPIVGVQVRRTDKINREAKFYPVEKYMKFVAEYFDRREEIEVIEKRRVYLATDEPSVITEARKKFPNYEFINDPSIMKSVGKKTADRNSDSALRGIIMDVHFLSHCDYLVCTHTSNVCRLVYELMQPMHGDASSSAHSLDSNYYVYGQHPPQISAVERHVPARPSEIALEVGDVIQITTNQWGGYSTGVNIRKKKTGSFPSYKVDYITVVRFPLPQK